MISIGEKNLLNLTHSHDVATEQYGNITFALNMHATSMRVLGRQLGRE
jgi:hypothetical protein